MTTKAYERATIRVTQELIDKTVAQKKQAREAQEFFPYSTHCLLAQAAKEQFPNVLAGFAWFYDHKNGLRAMMSDEAVAAVNAFDKDKFEELHPFEFEIEWIPL